MSNRRLGTRRWLRMPDLRGMGARLATLRLPLLPRKNRKKLRLFTPDANPGAQARDAVEAGPTQRERRGMLRFALGVMAFLAPLVAAFVAFAMPLIGVRAYEYVLQSGYFHVRTVVIADASPAGSEPHEPHLTRAELLEIAGIDQGTHVLEADLDQMTRRLVDHPWIRWARVDRELPDRLVVSVVEHRARAYLAAGELYLVDELGVPFALAPADLPLALPVISGLDRERLADLAEAPAVQRELSAALNVFALWQAQGLSVRYPVSELRLLGGARFAVVLESQSAGAPTEIVLGRGPFREKLFRLEWVLEHLRSLGETAEYVLLDLADEAPGAIEIGGARVVVKTELDPEHHEPAGGAVTADPAPDAAPATPEADPRAAADRDPGEDAEAAPLSGGRPAAPDAIDIDDQE